MISQNGYVGYFSLEDWLKRTFTDREIENIDNILAGLGNGSVTWKSGKIDTINNNKVKFLSEISGWFSARENRKISREFLLEAEHSIVESTNIIDIHFLYHQMVKIFYKDKEDQSCLDKAIHACNMQISIAESAAKAFKRENKGFPLPSHTGYEQLCVIYEKREEYENAINLCKKAKKEKWCGDWDYIIERCMEKLAKKMNLPQKGSKKILNEIQKCKSTVGECFELITNSDVENPSKLLFPVFDKCIASLEILKKYEEQGIFNETPTATELLASIKSGKDGLHFTFITKELRAVMDQMLDVAVVTTIDRFLSVSKSIKNSIADIYNPSDVTNLQKIITQSIEMLETFNSTQVVYDSLVSSLSPLYEKNNR